MVIASKICNSCSREYQTPEDYMNKTSRWRLDDRENLWFNCNCDSTLLLKKGQYDWFTLENSIQPNVRSLFVDLNSKKSLPCIKNSVLEIQNLLANEDLDMEKLAKILRKEPILLSKIIELTNRLKNFKSDSSPIEDIEHAIIYAGISKIKDIVFTASLSELKISTEIFNVEKFWDESFSQALIMEYLSRKITPYHNPEEMYLAGFLMKIGRFVSAYYYPEETDKIAKAYKSPKNTVSWIELEKIYSPVSYISLGEIASSFWGMPDLVLKCCANHQKISNSVAEYINVTDLAVFASSIASWIRYDLVDIDHEALDLISKRLKIKKVDMERLAYTVSDHVNSSRI